MHNIALGKVGEDEAANFLKKKGYKVLERNWRLPKFGEIDIIAKDKGIICFIEVKRRTSSLFGYPYEAVDKKKQFKLSSLALSYLKSRNLMQHRARFDIISIFNDEISLFANAFSLSEKFLY
ncbi:MAG: YraN family protein [Candidatus Omnitrophota bacterium]